MNKHKSHILIPKSILSKFSSNGDIYLYNKRSGVVKNTVYYNTESNFYSSEFEKHLSDYYECKLGRTIKTLNKLINGENITLYSNFDNEMHQIATSFCFRDQNNVSDMNDNPVLPSGVYSTEILHKIFEETGEHVFSEKRAIIMANKSEEYFLLPGTIFFTFYIQNYALEAMVLHPKIIIIFAQKSDVSYLIGDTSNGFITIDDCQSVININEQLVCYCNGQNIDIIGNQVAKYVELSK